jgi:SET domain-containing protein
MYPIWPMTQAAKKTKPAARPAANSSANDDTVGGRRTQVRESGVHGKGVYAIRPLKAGDTVLEYKGEIITWQEALDRHPHDPEQPNHTFYFHLDDGHVIDGKYKGNSAKWINHSCEPNLEAEQDGDRVFLKALRNIKVGEELFFDYGLIIDARLTAKLKKEYACWCGAAACRGTMLATRKRGKTND